MHRCRENISSQLYDMEGHTESNYAVISVKTKREKIKRAMRDLIAVII